MINIEKSKIFNCKNIVKAVLIVFLYVFVLRSYSAPVNLELIFHVNFRGICSQLSDMLTFSLLVNLTIIAQAICILTDLVFRYSNMEVCYYLKRNLIKLTQFKNVIEVYFDGLDVSNPFLYSNKTRGLLE